MFSLAQRAILECYLSGGESDPAAFTRVALDLMKRPSHLLSGGPASGSEYKVSTKQLLHNAWYC
jgi:hypothetical protein